MSIEESIALGEARLTSELMDAVGGGDGHQPVALAISLGITRSVDESSTGKGAAEPL